MHQDNNDHLAVSKKTHTQRKLTVRTELASSSQECQIEQVCKMCGLEFKTCYFKFGK